MKFHLGPWSVIAGTMLSVVMAGCNPTMDEKKMESPAGGPAMAPEGPKMAPAPDATKPETPAPAPDATKPPESSATSSDAAKPVDSAPAPKDDAKKEEPPK